MTTDHYQCVHCKRQRPPSDFGSDRSQPDGRNRKCRPCERFRKRAERATADGKLRNVEAVRRHRAKVAALTAQNFPSA